MKISEVLWKAANEHLSEPDDDFWPLNSGKWRESCVAAADAEGSLEIGEWRRVQAKSPVLAFLRTLGCKTGARYAFEKFPTNESRQGARYAWLMFASMYAEEQGL